MKIHINRDSDVPVRDQLAAQLVYLIGVGELRGGSTLPSVRALAQQLRVHRNTVAEAFRDPVLRVLVDARRGRQLTVRQGARRGVTLDTLIDATIAAARRHGYSPQQIYRRLHDRIGTAPPDRVLVVSDDPGLRVIMTIEIGQRLGCRVEQRSPEALRGNQAEAAGALVVTTPASFDSVASAFDAGPAPLAVRFASIEQDLARVRQLSEPSVIAIVSVSAYFLQMARVLLAAEAGATHSLEERLMTGSRVPRFEADLVLCDAAAYGVLRLAYPGRALIRHELLSKDCLDEINSRLQQARDRRATGRG